MDNSFSNDQTLFPKSITNRYAIKKQIGHGGMGIVYLAKDTQLLRDVAIKAIRSEHLDKEEVLKRIDRECKMHAAIGSHPHIVNLFDRIDKGGNIFLIMEYVQGETLGALIKSTKSNKTDLSPEYIVQIIIQTLEALECIHQQGVIHRDIKPGNIIVGGLNKDMPYAKIMDFGIAKDLEEDDSLTKLTMLDSGGPGTPAYMAPERIDSATFGKIVPATDLYAIGIILFELFQKTPPFHGTMTEIFSGHLAKTPNIEELNDIPATTKTILAKALEKYPSKRYQTAQEFANDLRNANLICSDKTLLATTFNHSTLNINRVQSGSGKGSQPSAKKSTQWFAISITLLCVGILAASIVTFFPPPKKHDDTIATTPAIPIKVSPPRNEQPIQELPRPDIPLKSALRSHPASSPLSKVRPKSPEQKNDSETAKKAFEARQKEKEEAARLQRFIKLQGKTTHNTPTATPQPKRRKKRNTQSR